MAFADGHWQPASSIMISLSDAGFLQGATVVDRLRSFGGRFFDQQKHWQRFGLGCERLQIECPAENELSELATECLRLNQQIHDGDLSIVTIATPGPRESTAPRLIMHPDLIPWSKLRTHYEIGTSLLVASNTNVSNQAWPSSIKTRSRLQYYLADLEARTRGANWSALLLDSNGFLTDTSSANVVAVKGGKLLCPEPGEFLTGTTLARTLELADEDGIAIQHTKLKPVDLLNVDELLMMNSTGILWPVNEFAYGERQKQFPDCTQGSMYGQLKELWNDYLQFDFTRQALETHRSLAVHTSTTTAINDHSHHEKNSTGETIE